MAGLSSIRHHATAHASSSQGTQLTQQRRDRSSTAQRLLHRRRRRGPGSRPGRARACFTLRPRRRRRGEMEVAAAAASYVADVDNLKATELRLGLPGTEEEEPAQKATTAALLPTPPSTPRGKKRDVSGPEEAVAAAQKRDCAPPAAKAQVVGWPPVRSYRKSCFQQSSSSAKSKPAPAEEAAAPAAAAIGGLFVKVSMDGAPYLRKIDLKMYKGYRELREALEAMFLCFSGGADAPAVNPSDFAVTYEDKDGDLMLVGDVPFDMFISTCKRLRIMKGSEARGLGSVKSN